MSQSDSVTFDDPQGIHNPMLYPRFASSIDDPFPYSPLPTGLLSPDPSDHGANWPHTDFPGLDSHPSELTFCSEEGDLWMRQGNLPPSESEAIRRYYDQLHYSAPFCLMTQPFFDDGAGRVVSKRELEPEVEPPKPKKRRMVEDSSVSSSGSSSAGGSCGSVMVQEEKSGDTDRVSFISTAAEITRMVRQRSKVDRHHRKKNIKTIKSETSAFVAQTKATENPSRSSAPFTSSSSPIRPLEHHIDEGTTGERCTTAIHDKIQEKSQSYNGSHHPEDEEDNEKEDDINPGSYDMTKVPELEKEAVQCPDAEASTNIRLPIRSDIPQTNDRYTKIPELTASLASRHQENTRLSAKSFNREKSRKDSKLRDLPFRTSRTSSTKPPTSKVADSLNTTMFTSRMTRSKSSPADNFLELDRAGNIVKAPAK
ncbi:hypothetical protein G7Y79_00046g082390 [Physcia stellaris]|nr:hypothetical protein G7Y79_00046g082390 [Physcia stellaris]